MVGKESWIYGRKGSPDLQLERNPGSAAGKESWIYGRKGVLDLR